MNKSDFSFELPEELIAKRPVAVRSASRLLVLPENSPPQDGRFRDVVSLLKPEDLVVLNDSRVIRARLQARKSSGGRVEVLLERIHSPRRASAHLGANRKIRPPATLLVGGTAIRVTDVDDGQFELELDAPDEWGGLLADAGEVPLPPYLGRAPEAADEERYQTVYARADGSVAAPTAGLHFDAPLLEALAEKGVATATLTLHIGGGTFLPLRAETLDGHKMHSEHIVITEHLCESVRACRARKGRVVAVGTTSLRALEAAVDADGRLKPCERETDIFIRPGRAFRVADVLITNFHLPETTLFVLVCAFAGTRQMRAAYAHAIQRRYRFFSYGDAMWIECAHRAARAT